jgi:hypothetical protein
MERKVVIKWLKIFSISFLILSLGGLIDFILFSTIINVTLDSEQYTILAIIFQSGFMSFHAALLWIILLCIFSSYIVLSYSIFTVAKKNTLDDKILAKFLLLIGLFQIIGGFITLSFLVLLGNSTIDSGLTTIIFRESSVIGGIMWTYFIFVVYCFLVSGLIFGGIGLKWTLLIQEEETSND